MRKTPGPFGMFHGNRGIRYGAAALMVISILLSADTAQAQDARAILQKVARAYKDLTSYEGAATVDLKIIGNEGDSRGKTLQTQSLYALLKFKKPNKITLEMTAPTGSRSIYSDGKDFYVYDALNRQYLRDATPATSKELLSLLLRRAGIQTALDPLYFLTDGSLPSELGQMKVTGSKKLNGRDTIILTGVTRAPRKTEKMPNGQTVVRPATTRVWTWWVDKQDHLLRRVEVRTDSLQARYPVQQGKKVVLRQIAVYHLSRHTVAEAKPNSNINDAVFTFNKPANASEKKTLQDLLKGAQ